VAACVVAVAKGKLFRPVEAKYDPDRIRFTARTSADLCTGPAPNLSQDMDSRQRFVLAYASLSMAAFTLFTFLNTSDLGILISAYTIEYFVLKSIMQLKMKFKIDLLGLFLLVLFISFITLRAVTIIG
jgi:hypothetical protein